MLYPNEIETDCPVCHKVVMHTVEDVSPLEVHLACQNCGAEWWVKIDLYEAIEAGERWS